MQDPEIPPYVIQQLARKHYPSWGEWSQWVIPPWFFRYYVRIMTITLLFLVVAAPIFIAAMTDFLMSTPLGTHAPPSFSLFTYAVLILVSDRVTFVHYKRYLFTQELNQIRRGR